jgi:anti-sigma B factor antagonist
MEIETSLDGAIAILRLTGRLTVSDKPGALKLAAVDAINGGSRAVLLDLSRVPYIDSTRLGELIAAHISVAKLGGRLALIGTTARITELFVLAGLEGIFETFPSVDSARAALCS